MKGIWSKFCCWCEIMTGRQIKTNKSHQSFNLIWAKLFCFLRRQNVPWRRSPRSCRGVSSPRTRGKATNNMKVLRRVSTQHVSRSFSTSTGYWRVGKEGRLPSVWCRMALSSLADLKHCNKVTFFHDRLHIFPLKDFLLKSFWIYFIEFELFP